MRRPLAQMFFNNISVQVATQLIQANHLVDACTLLTYQSLLN